MTHGSVGKDGTPRPCNPKKRKDPQPEEQLRDIYIAPKGYAWVYFDLSQCEMKFSANLSGDAAFIESCKADVHAGNARVLFAKVPGALEDLKDPKGAGKRFRDIAKNCGFAITYLAEADKLFTHLLEHGYDIDLETCQDAIDAIHSTYWRYFEWVNENIALCRKQGYLRSAFLGRRRWLGYYPKPTEVANTPIQSGVADVMNERLGIIDSRMPKQVKHLIYQYDSSIYEVPERLVDKMKAVVNEVWAEPVKVPATGIEFMQPIDLKVGTRWSDFG
jgi:DNA polymerase I-like protein with 3'-5' exonuclease and polymerase domains